jgi:hypothetical protein
MKKTFGLLSLLIFSAAYLLGGVMLYAGDDVPAPPSLSSMYANQLTMQLVPLSDTNVAIDENVLFDVSLINSGNSEINTDLWFTVDLTGIDHEKQVTSPYLSKESPLSGLIRSQEQVDLQFSAHPLDGVPVGPYTFYAKAGMYDRDWVNKKDSFNGVIVERNIRNQAPGANGDAWVITSVRALNEAGRVFLAGSLASVPRAVEMVQNYPNPFNPSTSITYEVRTPDLGSVPVSMAVYDVRGRLVRRLVDGRRTAGIYTVRWNGRDERGLGVESGIYIFRVQSGHDVSIRKGVLTK